MKDWIFYLADVEDKMSLNYDCIQEDDGKTKGIPVSSEPEDGKGSEIKINWNYEIRTKSELVRRIANYENALQNSTGSERVRNLLGLLESLDMLKGDAYIGAERKCKDLERLIGSLRTREDNPLVIHSKKRRKYAYVLTALGLAAYALL